MRPMSITVLCLALMLLVEVTYQFQGLSNCPCLKTSYTVLRKTDIKSYERQRAGICQIEAIIFKTVRGLTYCSDPKKPWVIGSMHYVDKKSAMAIKTTAQPINSTLKLTSTPNITSQLNIKARTENC